MNWIFRKDIDHIFDVVRKAAMVIKSCEKPVHINGAYNYVDLLERYLTFFEKDKKAQEWCDNQILQFKKMLKIKRRTMNVYDD